MNKAVCNNTECLEFDCEFYENNGTQYGYCWAFGCCTNEIDFDKVKENKMKVIIDITDEYYESILDLRDRYGEEHLFTSMKAILNGNVVDKENEMVAIKNFKMPENCGNCNFYHINEKDCDYCDIDGKEVVPFGDNRRDDCLLIEIEGRCDS